MIRIHVEGDPVRGLRREAPVTCDCPGYPCEHSLQRPTLIVLPDLPRKPLTMAVADELDASGLHAVADIARRYAVDRPRWWHRFRKGLTPA